MRSRSIAPQLAEFIGDLPIGLRAWDGSTAGPTSGPALVLRSRRALRRLLWDPNELGLARAYVSGDLDVDGDLTEGLRRFWATVRDGKGLSKPGIAELVRAVPAAARLGVLGPRPKPPAEEARLTGRLHTTFRDRAAIAHHYDLGNDFYEALLDPSMAYSCAYYPADQPDLPLADAQRAKLDLICDKLSLRPGMRVLDVGCGWGSFVVHATKERGVDVTGITLSARQAEHVRHRIGEERIGDRARVNLLDYRELTGEPFDAIVSVEMGEHVGEINYPEYTATLFRMLKPGGSLLLQQMSRAGNAPGGGAFIESYIAPDMTMRPLGRTIDHLNNVGFEVRHVEAMREMYALTIRAWLATLEEKAAELTALSGPGTLRVWRLYLAGGALAFEENRMGVDQILAGRTPEAG
ncbi:MAG TPA: cyclopropane-fatty-acyl-phospholipid synthase family protein [Pseudonocardiaceae bacterium]